MDLWRLWVYNARGWLRVTKSICIIIVTTLHDHLNILNASTPAFEFKRSPAYNLLFLACIAEVIVILINVCVRYSITSQGGNLRRGTW